MKFKPLVIGNLPESDQKLVRATIADHKATGTTSYSRFAMNAARLREIDALIDNARNPSVKYLRELMDEEAEILAQPFDVCRSGLLIDRDVAVAEIHEYYEALTPKQIDHALARGGEFKTKTAVYKAAE